MASRVKWGWPLALLLACGGSEGSRPAEGPAPAAPPPTAPSAETPVAAAAGDEVGPMVWLDPKASGVAWVDLPGDLSPEALSAVFALPPRASALLAAPHEVDEALHAILGEQSVTGWFPSGALVTTSMLTTGPYVIRGLAKPRQEIAERLREAKFEPTTTEGFEIWEPRGAFPWKVVMLDEVTVAFVPIREPGTGLTPLTAGRDMPASDLERELTKLLAEDSTVKVALYAAGPMLHFDVEPILRATRLELRTFGSKGLDGRVFFEPEGEAAGVAQSLSERAIPEETAQLQLLAEEVAYQADGTFVIGRLQIPATKIAALEDAS